MKKFLLFAFALVVSFAVLAQNKASEVIKFEELTHNFGKIKLGSTVSYDFKFTNIGQKPLVIQTALGSCGCTTPTWPKQPISKGKSDVIKAGFLAESVGPFEKTIMVKIQGIDLPVEIRITGEVLTAEEYAKYLKEKSKSNS